MTHQIVSGTTSRLRRCKKTYHPLTINKVLGHGEIHQVMEGAEKHGAEGQERGVQKWVGQAGMGQAWGQVSREGVCRERVGQEEVTRRWMRMRWLTRMRVAAQVGVQVGVQVAVASECRFRGS